MYDRSVSDAKAITSLATQYGYLPSTLIHHLFSDPETAALYCDHGLEPETCPFDCNNPDYQGFLPLPIVETVSTDDPKISALCQALGW